MRSVIPQILLAALIGSAVGGPAVAADAPKAKTTAKPTRACFQARDVGGWRVVDNRNRLNIRVRQRDYYTAGIMGICPSLDFAQTIALETYTSSFICEGDDARLVLRVSSGPERCNLQKFRKLSKDEVAALSKGDKP